MTNNTQSKLNDALCSKDTISNDLTTAPTIDEKQKKDIQCHPKPTTQLHRLTPRELYLIDRRAFNKSYRLAMCPYCGHDHPVSRYTLRKIKQRDYKKWSNELNSRMTPEQRTQRATKAGIARAIKAGQKLRKPINVQEGVLVD